MPMPGFLSNIADKAQSAINASPLAAHLPGRPTSPGSSQPSQPKSHATLENISHHIRTFGQQYSSATPVQKIVTAEKGLSLDFDTIARDSKAQSKELYTWGQSEAEDLKDVTDRLAYLNFVQGSLAGSLSAKLDTARTPFKALRDAEAAIAPRRAIRQNLQMQFARLEHDQQKGQEKKLVELTDQIRKAELDDAPQEREIEILKRKAVRESERLKWEAIREFGEKLVLLSQAATPIIAALPSVPPTSENSYTGAQATGAARASLQRALDNYKTGHINLPPQSGTAGLSRSDTQSFGESHASELSSIHTPPSAFQPSFPAPQLSINQGSPPNTATYPQKPFSRPLDPSALNNAPALIPSHVPPTASAFPEVNNSASTFPTDTPTVAETGVPVTAGADGPGPGSGSLRAIHQSSLSGSSSTAFASSQRHETAEEEKRRLAAAYSQSAPTEVAPAYETAEDEKKRLEREERDCLLKTGTSTQPGKGAKKSDDDELPPYQGI